MSRLVFKDPERSRLAVEQAVRDARGRGTGALGALIRRLGQQLRAAGLDDPKETARTLGRPCGRRAGAGRRQQPAAAGGWPGASQANPDIGGHRSVVVGDEGMSARTANTSNAGKSFPPSANHSRGRLDSLDGFRD